MAEAVLERGGTVVLVSTDLVFDGERGLYSEDDPVHPIMDYGAAKAEMERRALALPRGAGGRVVIVRTSLILTLDPPGKHIAWLQEVSPRKPDVLGGSSGHDARSLPWWLGETGGGRQAGGGTVYG